MMGISIPLSQRVCSLVRLVCSWVVLQSHNASLSGVCWVWFVFVSLSGTGALLGGWGWDSTDCFLILSWPAGWYQAGLFNFLGLCFVYGKAKVDCHVGGTLPECRWCPAFWMGTHGEQPRALGTWTVFVPVQLLLSQSRLGPAESVWHSPERWAAWVQSSGSSKVPSSLCPPHKGRASFLCYSCLSLVTLAGESLMGHKPVGGSSQLPQQDSTLSQVEGMFLYEVVSLSPVPVSISRSASRNMAEQTPALVAAPLISGLLSLYLPYSWPKYCCCSISSFLPSWQWCREGNLYICLLLDPGFPAYTCNACNPQVICHPGVRCFRLWTLHPKRYVQLCLTEVWGFLWNSIIVFTRAFLTFKILFSLTPRTACSASKGQSWPRQTAFEQGKRCWERGRAAGWLWQHMWLLPSISPCGRHVWNESTADLQRVPSWVLPNL